MGLFTKINSFPRHWRWGTYGFLFMIALACIHLPLYLLSEMLPYHDNLFFALIASASIMSSQLLYVLPNIIMVTIVEMYLHTSWMSTEGNLVYMRAVASFFGAWCYFILGYGAGLIVNIFKKE